MPVSSEAPDLPWHYISKLVCIGDSGTGKSSLTIRLCERRFVNSHDVTVGVEFGTCVVEVGKPTNLPPHSNDPSSTPNAGTSGTTNPVPQRKSKEGEGGAKRMRISVWDTAGQETYKSITRSYFRGASGALLVFDITRRSTFESATSWLNDLRQIAEDNIVVLLVGNKCDLADAEGENKRAVTQEEAEEWCEREGVMRYVETSAKSGAGVERAFLEVAERIYQNIEAGKYDLNDRRSGVKRYGTGAGREGRMAQKTVSLDMNDAMKGGQRGVAGGCC